MNRRTSSNLTAGVDSGGTGRRRGRPRDEELDRRILDATLALIDSGSAVTVQEISARTGVGNGTIYLRWTSVNDLIAAALDLGLQQLPPIPTDGDLRAAIFTALTPPFAEPSNEYSHERLRQRIRLVMTDHALQEAYWRSNVSQRRLRLKRALEAGVTQGLLRRDLDIEASLDLLAGVGYFGIVARGARLDEPKALALYWAAIDIAWRGMLADPSAG